MNDKYYSLKRTCYSCICITQDYNGSCTIWNTYEEAWHDAVERAEAFVFFEDERFSYKKVPDGFEILDVNGRIVRCYKVFETRELE